MKQESQNLGFAGGLQCVMFFMAMALFLSGASMAKDEAVCLDTKAMESMKRIYLERRDENLDAVKNMLQANETVIRGTRRFANDLVIQWIKEKTTDDPLLTSLNSANSILTEFAIKKTGRRSYLRKSVEKLESTKSKYEISKLELQASSRAGLRVDEVFTLLAFAATRAKTEALREVVGGCQD